MSFSFGLKCGKWSLGLLASLGMFLGACHGQSPSTPPKYIVRKMVFQLPFMMDAAIIADVREMDLWVRDVTGQWEVMDRVPPTSRVFSCKVSQDGEYGFSIVMVEKNGKFTPADPTQRPPELLVQVETKTKGSGPISEVLPPGSTPAKSSLPPPTLKFTGNHPMLEANETPNEETAPKIPAHETEAAAVGELPSFSPESLHDAVLQHDAGTSVSTGQHRALHKDSPGARPGGPPGQQYPCQHRL
jgi:hypothetical protein